MTTAQLYKYVNSFLMTLDKFNIATSKINGITYVLETWELVEYWKEARNVDK